jgi:hypothetical protein
MPGQLRRPRARRQHQLTRPGQPPPIVDLLRAAAVPRCELRDHHPWNNKGCMSWVGAILLHAALRAPASNTSVRLAVQAPSPGQWRRAALAKHEISRFPHKERPHMPGSTTAPGRMSACNSVLNHFAFRQENGVGTQDDVDFAAKWPAYAIPCRRFADALADICARLGPMWCYPFIAVDFHHLLLAGLPAHSLLDPSRRLPDRRFWIIPAIELKKCILMQKRTSAFFWQAPQIPLVQCLNLKVLPSWNHGVRAGLRNHRG